ATASIAPPGGKPTRSLTGRDGYSCAKADAQKNPRTAKSLSAEIIIFHQVVLLQLPHPALEHDLAVHDDVAAIGDADRLVEVLLRHQHRQAVFVLQLLDLGD